MLSLSQLFGFLSLVVSVTSWARDFPLFPVEGVFLPTVFTEAICPFEPNPPIKNIHNLKIYRANTQEVLPQLGEAYARMDMNRKENELEVYIRPPFANIFSKGDYQNNKNFWAKIICPEFFGDVQNCNYYGPGFDKGVNIKWYGHMVFAEMDKKNDIIAVSASDKKSNQILKNSEVFMESTVMSLLMPPLVLAKLAPQNPNMAKKKNNKKLNMLLLAVELMSRAMYLCVVTKWEELVVKWKNLRRFNGKLSWRLRAGRVMVDACRRFGMDGEDGIYVTCA